MEFKQITRLPSAVPAARKIPKRQKRRSVSAQMKWVRRFLRSEMDQAEFCRKHKLTPKTFARISHAEIDLKAHKPYNSVTTAKIKEALPDGKL